MTKGVDDPFVTTDLNTLLTALYVKIDNWLIRPRQAGRPPPTIKRSDLAGWAGYGCCSSHSRFFWGLRLHLICTPSGLPIAWTLATPKTDERHILTAALEDDPALLTGRHGQLIIADKGC